MLLKVNNLYLRGADASCNGFELGFLCGKTNHLSRGEADCWGQPVCCGWAAVEADF